MLLFKLVENIKLSEYFWASISDSHIFDQKEKFPVNFPKNASKMQHQSIVKLYVAHFEEKKSFVNIVPFYWFDEKQLFKKYQFSSGFAPFQTCWERQTFWVVLNFFLI